jgi:hypothetical protein
VNFLQSGIWPLLCKKQQLSGQNIKGKYKMTQFIREVVARLSGKAIVHAKCSDIKGRKSGGTRDNSGKDFFARTPTGVDSN